MQSIHSDEEYEEECKEQFRNLTDEQTGQHIGLEKVRNIIKRVDENYRKMQEMVCNNFNCNTKSTTRMWKTNLISHIILQKLS